LILHSLAKSAALPPLVRVYSSSREALLDLRPVEFAKHNNAGLVGPAALLSAFGVATWF
jgi:hypothetical protein